MVTERTIINGLIMGACCIIVPFVVASTLTIDFGPAALLGGTCALIFAFFILKDKLCICPLLGISITGSMNFLPLPLNSMHVFCILLILYYITNYVAIRQKRFKLGKRAFLLPILIITLIVLYHNHTLGVKVVGGGMEGGRPAILLYLVVIAYFCGINIASPSIDFLEKVPLYCVLLAGFSSIPFFLTTFIPALAPLVYYITDNVNISAYVDSQATTTSTGSGEGVIGRWGVFSSLGAALQLYLLAHYPIGTWWRPHRWWVVGLSLLCVAMTIASGYRSTLITFVFLCISAAWCFYSWRSLVLPAMVGMAGLLFVSASTNNIIHVPLNKLPIIAQRTLSFLPGDWDYDAIETAKSSDEFRHNIINVYFKENLFKSPWIGNGFSFDKGEYDRLNDIYRAGGGPDPEHTQAQLFILGKMFHTGWLSLYDIVGLVGSAAFIAFGVIEVGVAGKFIFGPKENRQSRLFPLYVWIMASVTAMMITFFTVFGDFGQAFPVLCIYGIVLSQLSDIESRARRSPQPPVSRGQIEYPAMKEADLAAYSRVDRR